MLSPVTNRNTRAFGSAGARARRPRARRGAFTILLIALLLAPCAPGVAFSDNPVQRVRGIPVIETFTAADYPELHGRDNQFAQDGDGFLYVTDTRAVLEFDGVGFHTLPLARGSYRAVAVDSLDRVFIGAVGRFGYLAPRERGERRYDPLDTLLGPEARARIDPLEIAATDGGVYVLNPSALLRVQPGGGAITEIPAPAGGSFQTMLHDRGRVFVHVKDVGLCELSGDSLSVIRGTEPLADHYFIRELVPLPGAGLLIASEDRGLYRYDGSELRRWNIALSDFVEKHGAMSVKSLPDGGFAVCTYKSGVVLANRDGSIRTVITSDNGLPSDITFGGSFLDREGGLWVSTAEGIARIELSSGIELFNESFGLEGVVKDMARVNGELWFGSTLGLYRAVPGTAGRSARFVPVDSVHGATVRLLRLRNGPYLATNVKLHRLIADPPAAVDVYDQQWTGATAAAADQSGERIAVCGYRHVYIYERTGDHVELNDTLSFPPQAEPIRALIRGDSALWVTIAVGERRERIVSRFELDPGSGRYGAREQVGVEPGAGGGEVLTVTTAAGRLVAGTHAGFYLYRAHERRFAPSARLNDAFDGSPPPIEYAVGDSEGRIWFVRENGGAGCIEPVGDRYRKRAIPDFDNLGVIRALMLEPGDSALWVGLANGRLLRYHVGWSETPSFAIRPAIRRAVIPAEFVDSDGDSVLFGDGRGVDAGGLELAYRFNSLRFHYALPVFGGRLHNEYQTRLLGFNDTWSAWTRESYRDFTDLGEGLYTLEVRARTGAGIVSETITFPFEIHPPWFRTWWAFLLWSVLLAGAVVLIVRWRLAAVQNQRRRLEQLVRVRSEELKRAEEEEKQLLLETERLSTKNKLAATIAHEFNNPLAIIQGMCELIERGKQLPPDDRDRMTRIRNQVTRMHEHVKRLADLEHLHEIPYAGSSTIIDLYAKRERREENSGHEDSSTD